jgi:hypothetical protein
MLRRASDAGGTSQLDRIEERINTLMEVIEALSKEVAELKNQMASKPRRKDNA